jgi:hypothetical protein
MHSNRSEYIWGKIFGGGASGLAIGATIAFAPVLALPIGIAGTGLSAYQATQNWNPSNPYQTFERGEGIFGTILGLATLPFAALHTSDALLNMKLNGLAATDPLFHPDAVYPQIQRGLTGQLAEGFMARLGAYSKTGWIPLESKRYTSDVLNQPDNTLCVATCGAQVLRDNEGIEVDILKVKENLNDPDKPNVRGLAGALNKILGENKYRGGRILAPDDPNPVLDRFLASGKSWVAGVQQFPESATGHAIVVRGITDDGLIKIVNPYGPEPGSGLGTIGTITRENFMALWSRTGYAYTVPR